MIAGSYFFVTHAHTPTTYLSPLGAFCASLSPCSICVNSHICPLNSSGELLRNVWTSAQRVFARRKAAQDSGASHNSRDARRRSTLTAVFQPFRSAVLIPPPFKNRFLPRVLATILAVASPQPASNGDFWWTFWPDRDFNLCETEI